MAADPKPEPRVRDQALLARLHTEWRECALCGLSAVPLSLHHVSKHPRDDARGNLVMLCGSGTTGCHGRIEANDRDTLGMLGDYIYWCRPDTIDYLTRRKGGVPAAREWLLARGLIRTHRRLH